MVPISFAHREAYIEFPKEVKKIYRDEPVSSLGVLTKEEFEVFNQIIHRLATSSIWSLLVNADEIRKLGKKVAHIHPLNFIEALHENPPLRAAFISVVERGGIICKEYLKKFEESLEEQEIIGNILPHLDHFSKKIHLTQKKAQDIFGENFSNCKQLKSLIL